MFLKAKANTTGSYRQARNALRDLWRLSHEADDEISVHLLRSRLLRLPKLALDYLDMRAPSHLWNCLIHSMVDS